MHLSVFIDIVILVCGYEQDKHGEFVSVTTVTLNWSDCCKIGKMSFSMLGKFCSSSQERPPVSHIKGSYSASCY